MKEKKKWIILVVIAAVVIGGALAWSLLEKEQVATLPDAARFKAEYTNAAEDNRFVYATNEEILSKFSDGTGVVFLGFPQCPWCQAIVPMLDEAAKAEGIDKIYPKTPSLSCRSETSGQEKMARPANPLGHREKHGTRLPDHGEMMR